MTRVSAMVNSLAADMQQRFFSLLAEATLFDPKCNQKGFHNPAETDEASKSITAASALMFSRQANEPHAESTRLPTLFWATFSLRGLRWQQWGVTWQNPWFQGVRIHSIKWKWRQEVYEVNGHYEEETLHSCKLCSCRENIFKNLANHFREGNRLKPNKVRQLVLLNANLSKNQDKCHCSCTARTCHSLLIHSSFREQKHFKVLHS